MEQPGPRPGPRPRPLIISHPELQSRLRRAFGFTMTLAAWMVWLLLLFPVLWLAAERHGLNLRPLGYFTKVDSEQLNRLLDMFPVALMLAVGGVALLFANGLILRWLRATREAPVVKSDLQPRTVMDVHAGPAELAAWRSARIVEVGHGANGSVTDVRVLMPASD